MPMTPLDYFKALVAEPAAGESFPVTEAAISIAQDAYPSLDLGALQLELDKLAAKLKKRMPGDAAQMSRLRFLNHFFFSELGFSVNRNDYYDPDNSYLNRVLERRLGIPISLAILYMEIGHQLGLALRGVSFPGHFLVKLKMRTGNALGDVFLDPCNGQSLSRAQLEERLSLVRGGQNVTNAEAPEISTELALIAAVQEAPAREIIARMLRNLKNVYYERRDYARLLDVQQRLVMLLPDSPEERRDRGLAYARLDSPRKALEDLNFYLREVPHAADAQRLRATIAALRDKSRR